MIRKSRRSPIKKLSHAATGLASAASGLVDTASHAVVQGAQLSSAVVAKASTKVEHARRSPDTRKGGMRSPDKRTPGRGGIRERIHQFDTACKDSNIYRQHQRRDGRDNRRHHRERQNEDVRSPPRHPAHQDKENEPNYKSVIGTDDARKPSPAIRRKKKAGRDRQGDAMEEGASSPVHHQRQVEPSTMKHPNRRESHGLKRNEGNRDLREGDEEDVGMKGPNEKKNDNMYQNDENVHCDSMGDDAVDIAELNRAALFPHRSKSSTGATAAKDKGKHRGHGVRSQKKRPRWEPNPLAHPLIQSPLRKHMKEVNDAACSNATCTITKEPFPLLPPGARAASNPLAAVAGWEVDAPGDERRERGRVGELNADGAERDGNDAMGKREDAGEALDLLSSAAFLFKHSRRNLG